MLLVVILIIVFATGGSHHHDSNDPQDFQELNHLKADSTTVSQSFYKYSVTLDQDVKKA